MKNYKKTHLFANITISKIELFKYKSNMSPFRDVVKLPPGEDPNEWVAANGTFYNL